jgi:hypothetical protein
MPASSAIEPDHGHHRQRAGLSPVARSAPDGFAGYLDGLCRATATAAARLTGADPPTFTPAALALSNDSAASSGSWPDHRLCLPAERRLGRRPPARLLIEP